MPAQVSLEQSLDAYEYVISKFGYEPVIRPGRIELLGWSLDYACGPALATFIDQILIRRLNDLSPDNDQPVILDCGANIGFSVLHYKRCFPRAKIVAFEPDPQFAPLLRSNLARNGATDVEVVEAAAWIRQGEARWLCEGIDGSKIIAEGPATPNTVVVRTVDLADYLSGTVDLLKLDIEGAEYTVLDHLRDRLQRVKNLLIECHLDQTNVAQFGRMLGILVAAGFKTSVNSFGPWRDLIRQEPVGPNHWEQYLLVAAWRNPIPQVVSENPLLPYTGAQPSLEMRMLRAQASNLGQELRTAQARPNQFLALLRAFLASGGETLQIRRLETRFEKSDGRCWFLNIPDLESIADDEQNPTRSTLLLFEDQNPLGSPHSLHKEIVKQGGGLYSHWKSVLYLSTSDGSDPNTNGRKYTIVFVEKESGEGRPILRERLEAREHLLNQLDATLTGRQAGLIERENGLAQRNLILAEHEADLVKRESILEDRLREYEARLLVRIGAFIRRRFRTN